MTDRKTVACGCDLARRQPGERLMLLATGEQFFATQTRSERALIWVSYAGTPHSTEELVKMIHTTGDRFKLD